MPTTKTTNRDSNVHKFSRKTEQAAADVVSLADEQGIWLPANTQVVVQQKSEKQIRNMYDAAVKREKELSAQIAINRLNILALEQ